MLSDEKIEKNFQLFLSLCEKVGDDRKHAVVTMVTDLADRIATAPASSRTEYHAAYPGGLVDHSLRVLKNARTLDAAYKLNLPVESLIISCLFHDFGKIGDLEGDLYLVQTDNWRREKLGEQYTINRSIQKMPNAERGLFLMQHYGVKLTLDEWVSIRCNDGPAAKENDYYTMHEPILALIVHQADRMACHQEKELSREGK
jgi:hypothetical protein